MELSQEHACAELHTLHVHPASRIFCLNAARLISSVFAQWTYQERIRHVSRQISGAASFEKCKISNPEEAHRTGML
jgi:hypothetical protein